MYKCIMCKYIIYKFIMYKCKMYRCIMYKCMKDKYIIVHMYKWMNVHIYKCLNPKYRHGQLYNVQMCNVQMYNVQKYNVQKDNVLNMSAVLGVILKVRNLVRPLGKAPSDQFQALPFVLRSPFSVCFDDIQNGSSF